MSLRSLQLVGSMGFNTENCKEQLIGRKQQVSLKRGILGPARVYLWNSSDIGLKTVVIFVFDNYHGTNQNWDTKLGRYYQHEGSVETRLSVIIKS